MAQFSHDTHNTNIEKVNVQQTKSLQKEGKTLSVRDFLPPQGKTKCSPILPKDKIALRCRIRVKAYIIVHRGLEKSHILETFYIWQTSFVI